MTKTKNIVLVKDQLDPSKNGLYRMCENQFHFDETEKHKEKTMFIKIHLESNLTLESVPDDEEKVFVIIEREGNRESEIVDLGTLQSAIRKFLA